MQKIFSGPSLAVLALAFPIAVLADVSNNVTISSGQHYSFDNVAASTSGGDIAFTGTSITLQGSATAFDLGGGGSATYGFLTSSTLPFLTYTSASISGGALAANEVIAVKTNGGHYVKILINSVTAASLAITYTAYGVTGSSNTPSITAVLDAGGYTPNIAQGSVFVVKGTNLSAAGFVQTSFPLPTLSNGVSISFAPLTGGSATLAYLDYLYNQNGVNQLAAILPSSVAAGTYNVTVTNAGATSAAFAVQVVKSKPGLITADSSGNGLVVVQNYVSASELDVNRFTTGTFGGSTISPAHPGQTEIAYLVGTGADPGSDNQASAGYNFLANGVSAQVIVGGTTIAASYLGRVAGGSGYEQINFTLPTNITTGCTVSFQVIENGVASQTTFIAIAPNASATACVQPGYTTSQLQQFDNGTLTIFGGGFALTQSSASVPGLGSFSQASAAGGFIEYTGFELAAVPSSSSTTLPSGCTVFQFPQPAGTGGIGTGISLDAGKVTLTGPSGSGLSGTQLPEFSNAYSLSIAGLGSTINGNIVAGTYTINGSGGTGVGAFSATVNLSPVTVTGGLPSTVTRSSGLTVNWSGGNSSDLLEILGSSGTLNSGVLTGAGFACFTTAGAKSFNVPSSILSQLPAINASQVTAGTASTSLTVSSIAGSNFNAPLVGGGTITNAGFGGTFEIETSPTYQ